MICMIDLLAWNIYLHDMGLRGLRLVLPKGIRRLPNDARGTFSLSIKKKSIENLVRELTFNHDINRWFARQVMDSRSFDLIMTWIFKRQPVAGRPHDIGASYKLGCAWIKYAIKLWCCKLDGDNRALKMNTCILAQWAYSLKSHKKNMALSSVSVKN